MSRELYRRSHPLQITRAEARLLDALRRGPGPYSVPGLLNYVHKCTTYYGDHKVVAVRVCRLRKALRPHGVDIENLFSRGYRINTEGREKLVALLGPAPVDERAAVTA